jgi:hypothetical protein
MMSKYISINRKYIIILNENNTDKEIENNYKINKLTYREYVNYQNKFV